MGWDLPQRPDGVRPPPGPRGPSPVVTMFETVTVFRPGPTVPQITHVTPPRASQPRALNHELSTTSLSAKFDPGVVLRPHTSFSCFLTPTSEYGC